MPILGSISSKFEVLSNPLRLLILAIIVVREEATWSDITKSLGGFLEKDVNPNSISFHLKKLQEADYVQMSGSRYKPGQQVPEILNELQPLIDTMRSETQ